MSKIMGRGLQKSDYMDGEPYDNDGNGNPERKTQMGKCWELGCSHQWAVCKGNEFPMYCF